MSHRQLSSGGNENGDLVSSKTNLLMHGNVVSSRIDLLMHVDVVSSRTNMRIPMRIIIETYLA